MQMGLYMFSGLILAACLGPLHVLAWHASLVPLSAGQLRNTSTQYSSAVTLSLMASTSEAQKSSLTLRQQLEATVPAGASSQNSSTKLSSTPSHITEGHGKHKKGSEWCALVDKTCGSNESLAMEDLWNDSLNGHYAQSCIRNWGSNVEVDIVCNEIGNLGGLQYASAFASWLRGPECRSSSSLFASHASFSALGGICCTCGVSGATVDLFYWPQPDADDSCLDVVGTEVRPMDFDATTKTNVASYTYGGTLTSVVFNTTYWGCSARHPVSGASIITTATVAFTDNVGDNYTHSKSRSERVPLMNPWSVSDCVDSAVTEYESGKDRLASSQRSDSNRSMSQSSGRGSRRDSMSSVVLNGTTL